MSGNDRTVVFQLPTVISGQLACVQGTVAGRSYQLSAGTFVIGRAEGSDLHLPNEPGVSKQHAKIVAEGDHYVLIDTESRNGTIVNGQPVQRVVLKDGDEIRVCGCVLRFTQTGGRPGGLKNPPMPKPPPTAPEAGASGSFARTKSSVALDPSPTEAYVPLPDAPSVPVEKKAGAGLFAWFAAGLMVMLLAGGGGFFALKLLAEAEPSDTGGQGAERTGSSSGGEVVVARPTGGEATAEKGTATDDGGEAAAEGEADATGGEEPAGNEKQASAGPGEGEAAAGEEAEAAEASGEPVWVRAQLVEPGTLVIRTRAAGGVRTVAVKDGARVEKGQVLAELDEQGNAAEIATLKESIRALESVADSQPSAKAYLEQEKAKLARLLAQTRNAKIVAPASGILIGFSLKAGERVRARQVIGKVRPDGQAALVAVVEPAVGKGLKRGAKVRVRTKSGEVATGSIASVKRQRSGGYRVVIDPGPFDPRDVEEVGFGG